jgi:glycosyltransferase involved in cell wall biosynthesis
MHKKKVSVLISNYNHANYLHRCLNAIVNQSLTPDEVIIIDDCSTDNSREILENYASNYSYIKIYFNERNLGPVINGNRLIELTTADYIVMTGSDDYLLKDYLLKSVNLMNNYPDAGLCCSIPGYVLGDSLDELENKKYYSPLKKGGYIESKELVKILKSRNFNINGNTCLLSKSKWIEFGGLEEALKWHCDWLLYYSIAFKNGICFEPQVLSIYRVTNISYSSTPKSMHTKSEVISSLLNRLLDIDYDSVRSCFINSGILAGLPGVYGIPGIFILFFKHPKYLHFFSLTLTKHLIKGLLIQLKLLVKKLLG